MRAISLIATLAMFILSGCATFQERVDTADATCASAPVVAPRTYCMQVAERAVWERWSPGTLAAYDAFSVKRLQLAEDIDAKRITPDTYAAQMASAKQQFATNQAQIIAALQAEQQERDAEAAQAILAGVASYYQNRANGDAAALAAMQRNQIAPPSTQHTTCRPSVLVPGQTDCTTTNY